MRALLAARTTQPHRVDREVSRAHLYARNIFANWFGYGANLLVLFFMSPFVVHTLGDVDYGVWSLMVSLTGYLGLAELGTRSGVGRFINYYLGKKDFEGVNAIISTGTVIFLAVGAVILLVAATLAIAMPWIFPKIPPPLIPTARIIVLVIALNVWLGFLSAPFRQLLQAHERFELTNGVDLLVLLVRTVATILALLSGYRLITLALIQLASSLLGQASVQVLGRRVFPELNLRWSLVSKARFRELFAFSLWAFVSGAAHRLLYSADSLVIAILLGPKWITYYAVGGMLLYKARDLVIQGAMVFSPKMLKDCARQDWPALQEDFRRGSRLSMGIGILLLIGMIAFGKEFIVLWMGSRFVVSYTILLILASSSLVENVVIMAGPVYAGVKKLHISALLVLAQGLVNLALTLFLVGVWGMGIQGVAWGTFFPRVVFSLVTVWVAMRLIGFSPWDSLATFCSRYVTLAIAFLTACCAIGWLVPDGTYPWLLCKVIFATVAYLPLAWAILLDPSEKRRTATWLGARLRPSPAPRGFRAAAIAPAVAPDTADENLPLDTPADHKLP
jgi:O-antigen/teichoic acid export membrane protein